MGCLRIRRAIVVAALASIACVRPPILPKLPKELSSAPVVTREAAGSFRLCLPRELSLDSDKGWLVAHLRERGVDRALRDALDRELRAAGFRVVEGLDGCDAHVAIEAANLDAARTPWLVHGDLTLIVSADGEVARAAASARRTRGEQFPQVMANALVSGLVRVDGLARWIARSSARPSPALARSPAARPADARPAPSPLAGAGGPQRLAVLEFRGALKPEGLEALADEARAAALSAGRPHGVSVMTRESIAVVLKDMTGSSVCVEGECEVETARNIGADLVITGSVLQLEGTYLVNLKLHESARGTLLGATQIRGKATLELVDGVREAVTALLR
jgi:hypothetical protein